MNTDFILAGLKNPMSCVMSKSDFCLCQNKGADQLISAFVFSTQIVQFLLYVLPKVQDSSFPLCLYRPDNVTDRVGNPVDRFSCFFFVFF